MARGFVVVFVVVVAIIVVKGAMPNRHMRLV
jgi:hypothetical protein